MPSKANTKNSGTAMKNLKRRKPTASSISSNKKRKSRISNRTENVSKSSNDREADDEDNEEDQDDDVDMGSGSENYEQEYEKYARTWTANEDKDVVERLPIKTASGGIKRVVTERKKASVVESDDEDQILQEDEEDEEEEEPELPELDRIRMAQEELSKLGSELIEDPEENVRR